MLNVMKGDHGEEAKYGEMTHDVHEKEGVDVNTTNHDN